MISSYTPALRCVALRCVALRCVALRCVALRCAALRASVVVPVGEGHGGGGDEVLDHQATKHEERQPVRPNIHLRRVRECMRVRVSDTPQARAANDFMSVGERTVSLWSANAEHTHAHASSFPISRYPAAQKLVKNYSKKLQKFK
jgi:hypothetical protein